MTVKRALGFFLAGVLFFSGCAVDSNPTGGDSGAKAASVEDLELTSDDLSGWENRQASLVEGSVDGFQTFNSVDELAENAINGGAYKYNSDDITRASIQLMQRKASGDKIYLVEIRIFNMSTNENARDNIDNSEHTGLKTLDDFGDEFGYAKYEKGATSCSAFAAYDKFYIELSFSGYSSGDDALTDARSFLRLFKKKTKA